MFKKRYARWMYEWETRLTTRDENRVVRPLDWGFEWIQPFLETHGFHSAIPSAEASTPTTSFVVFINSSRPPLPHPTSRILIPLHDGMNVRIVHA